MRKIWLASSVAAALFAADTKDHPTGTRITPPTLNSVLPVGIARGTTIEMTVEGLNLAKASAIYFSEPGVTGRILRVKELPDLPDIRLGSNGTPSTIDLGPLPPRNQVTVEVEVAPDAEIGPVRFRLLTPLGTSPEGRFLIEPYYGESPDREPNDTPENAFETYLPTILAGTVQRPGDVDYYKITVKAGEQLVFENGATMIGSTLEPVVAIVDSDQNVLREFGKDGSEQTMFAYRFEKAGTYYIRVTDYQRGGRNGHFYRIKAGNFPLVRDAYPMGLAKGSSRQINLNGWNLGAAKLAVKGEPGPLEDTLELRPNHSFNKLRLALGAEPEIESTGGAVNLPVTINARIDKPGAFHDFRFRARKGEKLVLEVNARRLGSELDSVVEVLDASGKSIERAVVRPVWETFTTLAEKDSNSRGIRMLAWNNLMVGDYVMIGSEIVRIAALPNGPDEDVVVDSFGGQRIAYFDTSTEAHAVDKPIRKVQILPPGVQPSPNGLPIARLTYRNDDGGPGYGKDSVLHFTAPADAEYIARIRDVRGEGGDRFGYRLTIRTPRPDFRLTANPRNPNVPAGGYIPVTVTAFRLDEFEGPIEVRVEGLPAGLRATKGVIGKGQVSTTILLSADAGAKLDQAAQLKVIGRANGVEHKANPDDPLTLVALMPRADISMSSETRTIEIEAGGKADIAVAIARLNGFGGRVPVAVLNLPPRVRVIDVGLNGVLINEDESRRSFTIEALPVAEPVEQLIWVAGVVETRSGLPSTYAAPEPILLKVTRK
jgi:hypothetical protein